MKPTLPATCLRIIRLLPILVLPLVVAACGTFPLSKNTIAPAGKTTDQHQLDLLTCQHDAKMAVSTAGRQAGNFLLGMTLIGTPVAYELDKAKQREVFAQCMTARGYTVVPVDGTQKQVSKQVETPALKADDVAQLEKLKGLQDRALITEEEYNRKKNEILDRM